MPHFIGLLLFAFASIKRVIGIIIVVVFFGVDIAEVLLIKFMLTALALTVYVESRVARCSLFLRHHTPIGRIIFATILRQQFPKFLHVFLFAIFNNFN